MVRLANLAMATAFVLAGQCAVFADDAKTGDPNPPDTVKVDVLRGDRWIYELRDDITNELKSIVDVAVTDVTDSEIDTRVRFTNATTNAESNVVQVFDPRWRLKENGNFTYRPADDETGIPADLQVGKTWTYRFELLRANPVGTFNYAGKAKVEAWEHVAVANGLSYDAFKIVLGSALTPVVNNRKLEAKVVLWYAPAVNRIVKSTFESRTNGKLLEATDLTLRDYQRRQP
ncbi:MAG: hypothetical protein E7774_16945 [Bradyrhizobium sp.]|nr:MAG: hypothetical protein E7774_16945 [Bradyrhizobium sp.]